MAWHDHRMGTNLPLLHTDFARALCFESHLYLAEHNAVNEAQANLVKEPDDANTLVLSTPWDYEGFTNGLSLRAHLQNVSFYVRALVKPG